MSGLSAGTYSCGGDAGRVLGGGEGDFFLKKVKMVLLFLLFFFFLGGVAFAAFAGATSTAISASDDGADERDESESTMSGGRCVGRLQLWVGCDC